MTVYDRDHLPEELQNLPESGFEPANNEWNVDERFKTEPIGFYKDAMRRLFHNRLSVISLCAIVIIIILSVAVPNLTGYGYTQQNVKQKNLPDKKISEYTMDEIKAAVEFMKKSMESVA